MAPKKKTTAPPPQPATPVEADEKLAEEETATAPPTKKKSRPEIEKKSSTTSSAPADDDAAAPLKRRSTSGNVVTEEMAFAGTVDYVRSSKDSDFDPKTMFNIMSWNVAGLRGFLTRGGDLAEFAKKHNPDVMCLQETKLSDWQDAARTALVPGYTFVDSISVAKKGYAGVRTYVREGMDVKHHFGFNLKNAEDHDDEGRVIITTLPGDLALINMYVPNSGMSLERLDFRVKEFDPMVRDVLKALQKSHKGGVIWTGDLNVAERDYDRFWGGNFKAMQKCPGFTPEERISFRETLSEVGLVDGFRVKYPNACKAYTFYSARFNMRAKGCGWRLDYFVLSAALSQRIVDCFNMPAYEQSDHCPLTLWLRR